MKSKGIISSVVLVACTVIGSIALAGPAKSGSSATGERGVARAPVEEVTRSGDHVLKLDGKTLHYRATAGTLTLRSHSGEPTASIFYVAYTVPVRKGAPPRPVTFFFNGGPGSASLWLNIGAFGPLRAVTLPPGHVPVAPYGLVHNQYSLLGVTDMVFIDAVGTGYSRVIGKGTDAQFWSVDGDVNSFVQAIIRYVAKNNMWNAPKFLYGESYGTTRAAALAYRLHTNDVELSGVILQSSLLNFGRLAPGLDELDIDNLPSFAAAAWYHHRVSNPPASEMAFLHQVEVFARGPYAEALAEGDEISPAHKLAVARQVSRFIGVPVRYVENSNLRIGMESFRKELLRDQDLQIGRFDSRYAWPELDTNGHYNPATNDPATAALNGTYVAGFREVLNRLGYHTALKYRALYNQVIEPRWNMSHKAPGIDGVLAMADTALDLATVMRDNPHLRVLSLNGLYDMSTPFFGTEFDLSHMLLPPRLVKNITIKLYKSGHQLYSDSRVLRQMTVDLKAFYRKTVQP